MKEIHLSRSTKILEKTIQRAQLSQYDYCSEATMPGNESIEC